MDPASLRTPTRDSSPSSSGSDSSFNPQQRPQLKELLKNPTLWKIVVGVLAGLMIMGWVFVIVILIREERWQLVLVAWLLLYSVTHFCYWYCKRHQLFAIHLRLCDNRNRSSSTGSSSGKNTDSPPTYDDILKSEPPPPAYYSVVKESPKSPLRKIPFLYRGTKGKVYGNNYPSTSTELYPTKDTLSKKPSLRKMATVLSPDKDRLVVNSQHDQTVVGIDQSYPAVHGMADRSRGTVPSPSNTIQEISGVTEQNMHNRLYSSGRHQPVNPLFAPIFEQMDAMPRINEETASMLNLSRQSSLASNAVERTNSLVGK